MRITRIKIRNFRSIEEVSIEPKDMLCLVGENNAGKSNILKAIDFVLGDSFPVDINKEDIFQNNEDLEVKIQILFDLTEQEHNDINQFRNGYSKGNIIGICFHKRKKSLENSEKRSENITLRLLTDSDDDKRKEEYISNEIKQIINITYIGSNRDVERHLGYGSKWTFMSKLSSKFDKELERLEKEAENTGVEGLKTQIQNSFKAIEKQFKQVDKFNQFDNSLQKYFKEHLPSTASEARYDISVSFKAYNPIHFFKSLSLIPRDNGKDIDLSQLGDGLKTILLLSYFKAYAEAFKNSSVLMIEEPEIYLHPHLRRYIFDLFQELATKNNVQVFYTTHSPDFIDVSNFENVGIVVKRDNKTEVKQAFCSDDENEIDNDKNIFKHIKQLILSRGSDADPTSASIKARFSLFYGSEQNEAFFAKKIILVEGATEFFTLPIYAKAMGYSFNKEGITIINCNSKDNIPYFFTLFAKCYGLPTYVIFDCDKGKQNGKDNTAQLNNYLLEALGSQLKEGEISENIICDTFSCFYNDFESFIKDDFGTEYSEKYTKFTSEARNVYGGKGEFKWFIQKYIANEIIKPDEDGVFVFDEKFHGIKKIIEHIFSVKMPTNIGDEFPF